MTRAELADIGKELRPYDRKTEESVLSRWDNIAKPIDGLGLYEKIIARIGGIQRTVSPRTDRRSLVLFFSDNGIARCSVSQSDVEVTHKVALATAQGKSVASVMAHKADIGVVPIDIGMKGEIVSGLINRRIGEGTCSFLSHDAMTEDDVLKAIGTGFDIVSDLKKRGLDIVLLGEMGVANTTTSTAVGCAILGKDPLHFTGHGAGLSEEALKNKAEVIAEGIRFHGFSGQTGDTFDVLRSLGGYDIAAMVGVILAGASLGVPVILDGIVSLAAALVSARMFPVVRDFLIASHRPKEPVGRLIVEELALEAPIDADLALGEGTGAILLVPQLDICLKLLGEGLSFEGLGMGSYRRFDA